MSKTQLIFVDVDKALAKDTSGAVLRELRDQLARGEERCRSVLDSGVTPAEAGRLSLLLSAYAAGSELLPTLWQIHQRREK